MYWDTRSRSFYGKTERQYIVVRHPLRFSGNNYVNGIKFCNGYGVVEKDSKAHRDLKRNTVFKKMQEFELSFLQKAGFRTRDVEMIFGKDIFYNYLDAIGLDKNLKPINPLVAETPVVQETVPIAETIEEVAAIAESEEIANEQQIPQLTAEEISDAHRELGLCPHIKPDGEVCESKSSKGSPSGYCFGHIKYDAQLKEEE